MSEELQPTHDTVEAIPDQESKPSQISSSINKLREVSAALTQLGEDLNQLVTALEELTAMLSLFANIGKKGIGPQGSGFPEVSQLLLALLGQQLSQNK
ncbi:MAG: hypothetical protein GX058_05125 [Firmicutes bacterium]|nr:hypothetical protein [Bacillota bacterium]